MERLATSNWPKCIKCIQPPERTIFFKQVMSSFNRFQYTQKNLGEKTITLPAGRSFNLTFSEGLRCPHKLVAPIVSIFFGCELCDQCARNVSFREETYGCWGDPTYWKICWHPWWLRGHHAKIKCVTQLVFFFVSWCLFKLCYRIKVYQNNKLYLKNTASS